MPPASVIGGYADYANLSQAMTQEAIDKAVMEAAEELGRQAGLTIAALQNQYAEAIG